MKAPNKFLIKLQQMIDFVIFVKMQFFSSVSKKISIGFAAMVKKRCIWISSLQRLKKIGPYDTPIGLCLSKHGFHKEPKNQVKIGLEYSDETFIFDVKLFSKYPKTFSIGPTIIFKVFRRSSKSFTAPEKNYERTIHTSKYIIPRILSSPSYSPGGGFYSFIAILSQFCEVWM